ncbi:hypothetical protein ACIP5U_39055 [Streptomyces sp. NPDC088788]|uniref:hypothetical protein n=1 Tax=Streptomyces sp. NPDC088788 TaxID=3365898 RepID=UPI00380BF774
MGGPTAPCQHDVAALFLARRFARAFLAQQLPDTVVDAALLVATELVTNAGGG